MSGEQHSIKTRWLGLLHRRRGLRRRYAGLPTGHNHDSSMQARYIIGMLTVMIVTLACINMAFVMEPGLPTSPIDERRVFLLTHSRLWQFGWLNWMLAALCLLVFCTMLLDYIPNSRFKLPAILLVAIGIAPDISAEMLYAFILPGIEDRQMFLLIDRIAQLLTGFVGNGAYCLGGLWLNLLLFNHPSLPGKLLWFGIPSWIAGLMISVTIALEQVSAAGVFTGIAMTWNVIWMFWFTRSVFTRPDRFILTRVPKS